MEDQPKIERLLRLMKYMSGPVDYSVPELAERLETSSRTIYRYILSFKDAGFFVRKINGNSYKLGKLPRNSVDIDNLVYFSDEEASLVNALLDQLEPTNSLKSNLKSKLSAICSTLPITDYVSKRSNAAHVADLGRAIESKLQAVLRRYESGHSNTVRDRYIEPFGFTTDFIDVVGYDTEDGRNKIFKISRIGEVDVTESPWEYEEQHKKLDRDVFRISGDVSYHVKLRLSSMAKNLLEEEYPMSSKHVQAENGEWILDTVVHGLKGVGRFVAGLMDEVEVLEGEDLKAYLKEYGKKFSKI